MTRIALVAMLSAGLSGFAADTAARHHDPRAGMAARSGPEVRPEMAVTAIKTIVNQSRWAVEVRNTENPHQERNGADVPAISTTPPVVPVDMWIPWVRTSSDFRTHHISVVLKDTAGHPVRRFAIWQHADIDGDWVRIGEFHDANDGIEIVYMEPGTHIRGASAVGGNRVLGISVNGDLSLSGAR